MDTASSSSSDHQNPDGAKDEGASPSVTIAPGTNDVLRNRSFVSRHRQTLDFIKTDAVESRAYTVPNTSKQERPRGDPRRASRLVNNMLSNDGEPRSCNQWLEALLPIWTWARNYDFRTTFAKDLVAGLTVGVMVIPQSMSYAKLAGLPVEFGLYSALVPVYAYSFFGSSRQLAVGPVAIISLILSTGLSMILDGDENLVYGSPEYQAEYNRLAVQTSFLVGLCYIVMGICQMGFVTIFLSHAVISGFTTGAAVIIGMSQVKYIFGFEAERSDRVHEVIYNVASEMEHFNWRSFLLGTVSIVTLLTSKNIGKTYPSLKWTRPLGPLFVTAVSIALTVAFGLEDRGIDVVGDIPVGFPSMTLSSWFPVRNVSKLMVIVISITIVGFMESIAIAKQLASKHKYEIDASTELIGLGMANFLGGMFNAYPITGSFSRSAVNNESGAQSGFSAMVTATLVGLALLLLTQVFEKMPLCVLASVVISGIFGLIDYPEAIYLWKVHRFDCGVWAVACLGTMFLGVEIGLSIAVCVSLLIVIYESAYPHTSVLGRLPGTGIYRNIKQYPEAERYDGIVLMRIDASLYFANTQNVRDKIRKYRLQAEAELEARNPEGMGVKYLILDMNPVAHLDTSALHILEDMHVNYRSRGQQLCFANPSLLVMDRLVASGLADKVGRDHIFAALHDAVNFCLHEMDSEATSIHESVHGYGASSGEEDIETGNDEETN